MTQVPIIPFDLVIPGINQFTVEAVGNPFLKPVGEGDQMWMQNVKYELRNATTGKLGEQDVKPVPEVVWGKIKTFMSGTTTQADVDLINAVFAGNGWPIQVKLPDV